MKKNVEVTSFVSVEVNETKFTPEFMVHFSRYFYKFDTIDEHIEHIAQLAVRGLWDNEFNEGYGNPAGMGIKVTITDVITDVEEG